MKYKINFRPKVTNFLFFISYMLFVFSLFNRDVSNMSIFYSFSIVAKYVSLIIMIIGMFYSKYSKKELILFIILLLLDLVILVNSKVLIFIIISLFAIVSTNINDENILKLAYYTLLIYTIFTLVLLIIGVYDDEITNRWVGGNARHTLGFYHSNVLPLIYSYLVGYGLACEIYKKRHYFLLVILNFVIYYLCGSRNVFFTTLLLITGKWLADSLLKKEKLKKIFNSVLFFLAKYIVLILTTISLVIPLLVEHIKLLNILDYILSYRFTAIAKIIQIEGIHLITSITNEAYFSNEIVIDNGYAFLAIRYGIIILLFLSGIVYLIAKRYRDNTFALILIIVVSCVNFIDNDIIDYSCLPYLIIGEKCIIESFKRRNKIYG